MDKYIILERYYPHNTYIKYNMRRKQKEARIWYQGEPIDLNLDAINDDPWSKGRTKCEFIELVSAAYFNGSIERLAQVKSRWSEKGVCSGSNDGTNFMLDEPSRLIYVYNNFDWKDFEETYLASLTPEEQDHYHKDSDDMPHPVDFFREGKAPYYYTMHKENFFELFSSWDACAQKEYDYIVWYEDETGWVRLQGFDSLDQAQEFIANK